MQMLENVALKSLNTFGLDVRADKMLVLEQDASQCAGGLSDEATKILDSIHSPMFILGGGSNVVFIGDYHGTIVRLVNTGNAICRIDKCKDYAIVKAPASTVLDELVSFTEMNGCFGLENLSAIPGTMGAAVVQNVGAYGVEIADMVERVIVYDLQESQTATFERSDLHFGYRQSLFKEQSGRYIVLSVELKLSTNFVPKIGYKALSDELERRSCKEPQAGDVRAAVTDVRWSKLPRPEVLGSAGSFFKNPIVDVEHVSKLKQAYPTIPIHAAEGGFSKLSAGWLVEQSGWKGRRVGRVGVYDKQALVIVNHGGGTGEEILSLASVIQADVQSKFGVHLEREAIVVHSDGRVD